MSPSIRSLEARVAIRVTVASYGIRFAAMPRLHAKHCWPLFNYRNA